MNCKCGCGQKVEPDKKGRILKYVRGHFHSNLPGPKPIYGRFWPNVKKSDGCWEWDGALTSTGYGTLMTNYKNIKAHRYSWIIHFGDISPDECVLHKCDNCKCVNPDHLFLGNRLTNKRDQLLKRPSEGTPLTNQDVRDIRHSFKRGQLARKEIAAFFGSSYSHITNIIRGEKRSNI